MTDRARAQSELNKLRRSLAEWLKGRLLNDGLAVRSPQAAQIVRTYRSADVEQRMALELHTLLSNVMDPYDLPSPDDPDAAVELAKIVVTGKAPQHAATPAAQGIIPILIIAVAGVAFLSLMKTLRTYSDNALEQERLATCRIQPSACPTDWTKVAIWGGVAVAAYLFLFKTEMGAELRGATTRAATRKLRGVG